MATYPCYMPLLELVENRLAPKGQFDSASVIIVARVSTHRLRIRLPTIRRSK